MGHAVAGRQVPGLADPDAEAVDPMAARPHENRSLLTDQPGPEPARLESESGLGEQIALIVRHQVAEQAESSAVLRALGSTDRLHAPGAAPCLQMQHCDRMP